MATKKTPTKKKTKTKKKLSRSELALRAEYSKLHQHAARLTASVTKVAERYEIKASDLMQTLSEMLEALVDVQAATDLAKKVLKRARPADQNILGVVQSVLNQHLAKSKPKMKVWDRPRRATKRK